MQNNSYKEIIKARVSEIKIRKPAFTWKKISTLVGLQYTYLSKVLNDEDAHLNEEALLKICDVLEYSFEESAHLLLLRGLASAKDKSLKEFYLKKLNQNKHSKILSSERPNEEEQNLYTKYLTSPLALIIHVSLNIKAHRDNPALLCDKLNISLNQLKDFLKLLDQIGG